MNSFDDDEFNLKEDDYDNLNFDNQVKIKVNNIDKKTCYDVNND